MNYDAWFDYLEIIENENNFETIRDTYERAIANVPPVKVRYNFIYVNFFSFNFSINSFYILGETVLETICLFVD